MKTSGITPCVSIPVRAPTCDPAGFAPSHQEEMMMATPTQADMPAMDCAEAEEITPQQIGFEAFVLWFVQQAGGRVSYIDYDRPNKDLGEGSDIAERFGRPKDETERLLDAIAYQDDHGDLMRTPYVLRQGKIGNKGKRYGTRLRVVVSLP